MDATMILIDSDPELARARRLVDRLWSSNDPADIARLQAAKRAAARRRRWIASEQGSSPCGAKSPFGEECFDLSTKAGDALLFGFDP
jgi:hypothetical protein